MRKNPNFPRGLLPAACLLLLAAAPSAHAQTQPPASITRPRPAAAVPPLYGPLGVTPQAVRQGQLGTCYFHAVIAALANHNAALIERSIHDDGRGDYTVRFADGTTETVHLVDILFARENRFDLSDGLWVTVLLRALAQNTLRQALLSSIAATSLPASAKLSAAHLVSSSDTFVLAWDRAIRAVLDQDGTLDQAGLKSALAAQARLLSIPGFVAQPVIDFLDTAGFFTALAAEVKDSGDFFGAYRAVGHGGLPGRVLRAFGLSAETRPVNGSAAARDLLQRVNDPGAAMIASTPTHIRQDLADKITTHAEPNWWVAAHAYTVLSYNRADDTVKLRNPWARMPDPDGIFTLPLADFLAAFSQVNYSK